MSFFLQPAAAAQIWSVCAVAANYTGSSGEIRNFRHYYGDYTHPSAQNSAGDEPKKKTILLYFDV